MNIAIRFHDIEYGAGIFPPRDQFFGAGDPTRYGEGLLVTKGIADPLFKVLPSYGGAQLKKTFQGIATVDEGKSTTKTGRFQYKVDDNFRNWLTAILFGKYALPEAIDYYNKKEEPKSTKRGGSNPFNPQ